MTMPPVVASDTNKSAHNLLPGTNSFAGGSKDTRLCYIVKRPDFDGYGFNLHSEKSKPGQFIGKIDANSPAEAAGLKEGDRIIEVNGLPIGNETHKQVVQRIKAIAWEVKLLVISENSVVDNITRSANKLDKPKVNNDQKKIETKTTSDNPVSSSSVNSNCSSKKNSSPLNQQNDAVNSPTGTTMTPPATTMTPNTSIVPSSSKPSDVSSPVRSSTPNANGTLKLPSTAAEMRAILQSKKKFNPKSDDVNIQKKFEIIQKL